MIRIRSLLSIIILLASKMAAQAPLHFAPFQGIVYDLPGDYLSTGYGSYLPYCDVLYKIKLDSLAVPKTFTHEAYFPGVLARTGYGIVFTSSVDIPATGCYTFSLDSDDGSRLWIADSLIINNDGMHKMTIKRDTVKLEKGQHPVKVWYYNAHETQFGLILKGSALPDSVSCPGQRRKIAFDPDAILFDHDSYVLTMEGKKSLEKLCAELNQIPCKRIHVIGHTDQSGTAAHNKELSLHRAQSIVTFLKSKLTNKSIVYEAEGRGSSDPVATGNSSGALQQNRRVEIFVE